MICNALRCRENRYRQHALFQGLLLGVLLYVAGSPAPVHAVDRALEYRIKAAFIYNFTQFIMWPDEDKTSTLELCVYGESPLGEELKGIAGKKARGRQLTTRLVEGLGDIQTCNVLYISASRQQHVATALAQVAEQPILTVSDLDGFTDSGGIIQFIEEGSRVRFAINKDVADRAGLDISSKLLRLAKIVRSDNGSGW